MKRNRFLAFVQDMKRNHWFALGFILLGLIMVIVHHATSKAEPRKPVRSPPTVTATQAPVPNPEAARRGTKEKTRPAPEATK